MPEFKKKIFYGEYTLLHWVELILTKNIILPAYQRSFVWEKEQVESYLRRIKEGVFVPPVIIGSLNHQDKTHENIILDGQQRLTSILLGYLGRFPIKEAFVEKVYEPVYTLDIAEDDTEDDELPINWTFQHLIDKGRTATKESILEKIDSSEYTNISEDALLEYSEMNSIYLGFSYIVPEDDDEKINQRFYSIVFHDINQQGVSLQGQESRRSLYYLNSDLVPFFDPKDLTEMLNILYNNRKIRYDYVRALAFIAQFVKDGNERGIAKRCKNQEQFELYFENYIDSVVNESKSSIFAKFSEFVGIDKIGERTRNLKESVEKLGYASAFASIIDADTKLFGLIYHIIYKGAKLNFEHVDELNIELESKISKYKKRRKYRSSNLATIRERIKDSVSIYSKYLIYE